MTRPIATPASRDPDSVQATHQEHPLVEGGEYSVVDLRCHRGRESWSEREPIRDFGVVFVRKGCFYRRSNGSEAVLDPAVAFFEYPGQEREIKHPFDEGDVCTWIVLSSDLFASVWAGIDRPPEAPLTTSAHTDLMHRRLLARTRRIGDSSELEEHLISLVASLLEETEVARVLAGRPVTTVARRRLVEEARAAITTEPGTGLIDLARRLAVSPHHLSRIFRSGTGETVIRYRSRTRVRLALERLNDGDRHLATIAADLGFADHAHLSRSVRRETGMSPSQFRRMFGSSKELETSTNLQALPRMSGEGRDRCSGRVLGVGNDR